MTDIELSRVERVRRIIWATTWQKQQNESSLGAHSFCWFCHVMAHIQTFISCKAKVDQLAELPFRSCYANASADGAEGRTDGHCQDKTRFILSQQEV